MRSLKRTARRALRNVQLFVGLGGAQYSPHKELSQIRFLLLIVLAALLLGAKAHAGTPCDDAAKGADCKVVKVLTKCDMDKYKLQKRIEKLQRELKELESREKTVEVRETVVEKVVEKRVTKTKIKHHIVSVFGHPAATSSASSSSSSPGTASATGRVDTEYVPGLMYQYQFNFGLVPMVGIDTERQLIFGLGFEF